jgi:small-conductance mechanosensitive channel
MVVRQRWCCRASSGGAIVTCRRRRNALALVSTVQLVLGLVGLRHAVRRGTSYDIGFLRGSLDTAQRDRWLMGTNLSAPGVMLLAQAVSTVLLATGLRRQVAARILGVLGSVMALGYPAEVSVRRAWRHPDRVVAPLSAAAEVLAITMAVLGLYRLPPARRASSSASSVPTGTSSV